MVREINHVGLSACDFDDVIHFYVDFLGGRLIRNAVSADGKARYVYIQLASGVVELLGCREPAKQGFAHVAFLLKGKTLDEKAARIAATGIEFPVPPKVAGSGNGRLAFFTDRSGIRFELLEREEDIRVPFAGNGRICAFDSIVLRTKTSADVLAPFYATELGLHRSSPDRFTLGPDCLAVENGEEDAIARIALRAFHPDDLQRDLEREGYDITDGVPYGAAYTFLGPARERIAIL